MNKTFAILRRAVALFLLATWLPFQGVLPTPVYAAASATPSAQDIDDMMAKLRSTDISYAEKKRLTAVVFVHQDVYRKAVILGQFPAKSPNVDSFLEHKSRLQADVAERMNMKHRNLTGENIKQPIIPFAYNNILSDDDVITGSGKGGKNLEKLYVESLDDLVRERAGQPMSAADRHRVDVNGLAWDMTQKGGLENYWHKEKYIQPQSGFANQQKLIEAGDKVKVMGFDANGKLVVLQGEEAKKAILSLTVDKPLDIPGMVDKGTGSMSDYARMAEIHQVKFKGTLTPEEIATFIRNQKYTDRVVADFNDIALKDNPGLKGELDSFINTSNEIRKQTTALGVAQILEKEYGIKIINADGSVNFDKMKEAMQIHQTKQLTAALPKMIGAVSANEAYKISQWLKGEAKNSAKRTQLRKQLALTYAPFDPERMKTIMADLDKVDMPDEERAWLKKVLTDDAAQIRKYAELMRLSPEELVRHLGIDGDNMRAVDLLESMDDKVRALGAEMTRRPGGGKMHEFLKSKTARALNLDTMLDGSRNERIMLFSMMLLAVTRAYGASERNDEAIKKAGMALFEMIPLVASVLRFSEGEFKESFRELAMDIFPPLALAQIAFMALGYGGSVVKNAFTETVWEGLVNEALKELTDDDFVKTEMKYYRLKDREAYFEFLQEVEAGFGRVAKLSAMMAPEIEVIMGRHPEVKNNDAALYACKYFEEFDVIDIRKTLTEKYSVEQIKSRFWAEGGPDSVSSASSPVERRMAWLIMENLKVEAGVHKQVLQNFIDRIEREYNKRKKDEEEIDPNGILENTRMILKAMFEGAPEVIKQSEWAFPKLKEEYRRLLEYLKGYNVEGKEELALKQEMQALIDDFRKFIEDLARAVDLVMEKAGLNLSGIIFGGEKSQISTTEVLLADSFRVGITATVQPKRAGAAWTVFYYISGADGGVKILGQKSLNPGQFAGGGEGLFVIDETAKPTQHQVAKAALVPDFMNEGEYSIFPVIAFGAWSDPIQQVGYDALNDPSEYPDLFEPERVAFAGSPASFTIRKAKVVIKTPQVVYKNDKAKAKAHLDVPEYARQENTAEGDFKFTGPVENILSRLDPMKSDAISLDPEKPTETLIVMDEKAEEGTYYVELKARLRGFPDEAQPLPQIKNFDFVNQNNPALGDDLTKLLEQMQGLEGQAVGILESLKSTGNDFLQKAGEASTALGEALNQIAKLESSLASLEAKAGPLLTQLGEIEQHAKEANRAGEAAAEAHSASQGFVLRTCEIAKSMQGVTDPVKAGELLNQAHEAEGSFSTQKSNFDSELSNARLAYLNAEGLHTQVTATLAEIKKEKIDTSALYEALAKASGVIGDGEGTVGGAEADAGKLSGIKDSAAALLGQAEQVLAGISEPAAKTANEEMFKQMQGILGRITGHAGTGQSLAGQMRAKLNALREELAAAETKINEANDRLQVFQYQIPDEQAVANAGLAADNARAAYETASIYSEAVGELANNCGTCLAEAERIFGKLKDPEKLTAALDCSGKPNTFAKWNAERELAECVCVQGYTMSQDGSGCKKSEASAAGQQPTTPTQPVQADPQTAVAQANCSMHPNTMPQWNAALGQVQCVCVSGTQWNGSACVADPQTQVAQANCSMYPNTVAQWNAAVGQVQCVCISGMQWNGSACVADPSTQVAQANCSMYPGTVAQWNAAIGQVQCVCASGTQWNGSSCVSTQAQSGSGGSQQGYGGSTDCSAYPGTSAVWNAAMGGMQCVCQGGTQWNGSSCVSPGSQGSGSGQQTFDPNNPFGFGTEGQSGGGSMDCSAYPGTSAVFNAAMGGMQCVCPSGTEWNGSSCASSQGGNPPPDSPPVDLISPIANAASGGGSTGGGQGQNTSQPCPAGTVNIGGHCYTQSSGGPVSGTSQPPPPQIQGGGGSKCPPGSIELLGVCSGT